MNELRVCGHAVLVHVVGDHREVHVLLEDAARVVRGAARCDLKPDAVVREQICGLALIGGGRKLHVDHRLPINHVVGRVQPVRIEHQRSICRESEKQAVGQLGSGIRRAFTADGVDERDREHVLLGADVGLTDGELRLCGGVEDRMVTGRRLEPGEIEDILGGVRWSGTHWQYSTLSPGAIAFMVGVRKRVYPGATSGGLKLSCTSSNSSCWLFVEVSANSDE